MGKEYTVLEVLDLETGETIKSSEYFADQSDHRIDEIHSKRRELSKVKLADEKRWVCNLCHQRILIGGGQGKDKRKLHFRHPPSETTCPYQDHKSIPPDVVRRMKYNGAKESKKHHKLKHLLAHLLAEDPLLNSAPGIEETYFLQDEGKTWRRPDVSCKRRNLNLFFEVQISTDYIDVIVGREEDYRSDGGYIFWIFDRFDPDSFTSKGCYVGNQKNLFIFNERAQEKSLETGQLLLECHFKKPIIKSGKIIDQWCSVDVTLEDLIFNPDSMQAYYFPYDNELEKLHAQKLRDDFEEYWCEKRHSLDVEDRQYSDEIFERRLKETLGEQSARFSNSQASMLINYFYSLKRKVPLNTKQNFYGLTDTVLQNRKRFTYIILLAIGSFGFKDDLCEREAFKKKYKHYCANRNSKEFKVDDQFNGLIIFLFPEIERRLLTIKNCQ